MLTNYCGKDFTVHVSLYTLNSLGATSKSYLNKTERKKRKIQQKAAKDMNRCFTEENRQMACKHVKGCSSI